MEYRMYDENLSKHFILTEYQKLLTCLKLEYGKFALTQDSKIVKNLIEIKELQERSEESLQDWEMLLDPVFQVIQSEETSGAVTAAALQSLQRFLEFSLIHSGKKNSKDVLKTIVNVVKYWQFEGLNTSADEAVLVEVLDTFVCIVESNIGVLLDQETLLEVAKSCQKVGRETRPSETLRQAGEKSLYRIVKSSCRKLLSGTWKHIDSLFSYSCDLADPTMEGKSAGLRMLGLSMSNLFIEMIGCDLIKYSDLLHIAKDRFFRALLRNVRTSNLSILSITLRGFSSVVKIAAQHLHKQIEVFLHAVHLNINNSRNFELDDRKEMILENLIMLISDPKFAVFLFQHYDYTSTSSNLFELVAQRLTTHVKDAEKMTPLHELSLKGILSIMRGIGKFCDKVDSIDAVTFSLDPELKDKKLQMMKVTEKISMNPKEGLKLLKSEFFAVASECSPKDVAVFLWTYKNWMSKNAVGEILRFSDEFSIQVLYEYIKQFSFHGMRIDLALRQMTSTFFLSGEGQQIQRILEMFSKVYIEQNPDHYLENADNAWMFSVAIMMLQSDLHKKDNLNKMTPIQFKENTAFIFENLQFANVHQELEETYNGILRNEMVTVNFCESHTCDLAWHDVVNESNRNELQMYKPSDEQMIIYNKNMFDLVWGNIHIALRVVLDSTNDSHLLGLAINGIKKALYISSQFKHTKAFDTMVISLCKFTSVLSKTNEDGILNFGRNSKAQLAAKTVFSVMRSYGSTLREGWKDVLDLILRIYELELLPDNVLLDRKNILRRFQTYTRPKLTSQNPSQKSSSFWGGFWGGTHTEQIEEETRNNTTECIKQCHIPILLTETPVLDSLSLEFLIKALILTCTQQQNEDVYTSMFCLDLLTDITIANQGRLPQIWKMISDYMRTLLNGVCTRYKNNGHRMKKRELIILERTVISIQRFFLEIEGYEEKLNELFNLLNLNSSITVYVVPQLCNIFELLLETHSSKLKEDSWNIVFNILRQGVTHQDSIKQAMSLVVKCAEEGKFSWPGNVTNCTKALMTVHNPKIPDIIYKLHLRMYEIMSDEETWFKHWLFIVEGLGKLSTSIDQKVRNNSFINLQKIIISEEILQLKPELRQKTFETVLFTLMDDLLNPEVKTNSREMQSILEETIYRAINLLSKTFLHFLSSLEKVDSFEDIWERILKYLVSCMQRGSNLLVESVPEITKNLCLVLNSTGAFESSDSLRETTQGYLKKMLGKDYDEKIAQFLIDPAKPSEKETQNDVYFRRTPFLESDEIPYHLNLFVQDVVDYDRTFFVQEKYDGLDITWSLTVQANTKSPGEMMKISESIENNNFVHNGQTMIDISQSEK